LLRRRRLLRGRRGLAWLCRHGDTPLDNSAIMSRASGART
jgi:hypothetical protein